MKKSFELIYGSAGKLDNIVTVSDNTLKAYTVTKEEAFQIRNLAKMYGIVRKHPAQTVVERNMDTVNIVRLDAYPLPGFINTMGSTYINLSVIPTVLISDYTSADIYSMFLYAIALKRYAMRKVDLSVEDHVAAYYFSAFMNIFGKKAGLLGSYKNLIPSLRMLINLYVHYGIMEQSDKNYVLKSANNLFIDPSSLNLNYDFSSTTEFLKAINENKIIPISPNKFSTEIISRGGMYSLPIFEDLDRLYATMVATTVGGGKVFSNYWSKIKPDLFQKFVYLGMKRLR